MNCIYLYSLIIYHVFLNVIPLFIILFTNSQINLFVNTLHASSFLNDKPHNLQNTINNIILIIF